MMRFATVSMALIFGTIAMAATPALAGSKGSHSSGSCHPSGNSSCCHHDNSGCCHKNPCDPGKGTNPPGVVIDPVHKPPVTITTINPVIGSPVDPAPTGGTPPRGLSGVGGAIGGTIISMSNSPLVTSNPPGTITGTNPGKGGNLKPY